MIYEPFNVKYQPINIGTESTEILFFDQFSDLFESLNKHRQITNDRRIFVTDTNVAAIPTVKSFIDSINKEKDCFIILESGEQNKTIDSVLKIISVAIENNLQRSSVFTGIGGGVVTDMTAMAASLFKRGADCELIPTTLLSMVDASMGGKTGCDYGSYKNMIGTFYPASKIYMCTEFIKYLSSSEYKSGLGEAVKTAMLYAPKLFNILRDESEKVLSKDTSTIMQIIKRCTQAKMHIVEHDLTESGLRMQLNLGHTFAHALETVAGLGTVPHGDAVAYGLGRCIKLSNQLNLCDNDYVTEVFSILKLYGWCTDTLHPASIISGKELKETAEALVAAMHKDKKNSTNTVKMVLQKEMNSTVIMEVQDKDILKCLTED